MASQESTVIERGDHITVQLPNYWGFVDFSYNSIRIKVHVLCNKLLSAVKGWRILLIKRPIVYCYLICS